LAVESKFAETDRLRIHYLESGAADGEPVVLIHGNLATGRFMEGILDDLPDGYRGIAPDMRGFGDTEPKPIDATRGLRDWADDTRSLVRALGIDQPIHLLGWSTGGAAIAAYTIDSPDQVRSITFIDPVSPYGFGSTKDATGTSCFDDYAGSGGGGVVPEFVERLSDEDDSDESPLSPRNVMNSSYWSSEHREPKEREDLLLAEVFKTSIGDGGYPGNMTISENWPGIAPGTTGILNASRGSTAAGTTSSTSSQSHRSFGPMGPRTSSSPTNRHGTWGSSAAPDSSRTGPVRTSFLHSRWSTRSGRSSRPTRQTAVMSAWR